MGMALSTKLEQALRPTFPHETIDIQPGIGDKVRVMVLSRRFDGMDEKGKQDFLWELIDKSNLTADEKQHISMILPLSPAEI